MPGHPLRIPSACTVHDICTGTAFIICPAFDTAQGHQPNLKEKAALVTKPKRNGRNKTTNIVDYRLSGTCTGRGGDGDV